MWGVFKRSQETAKETAEVLSDRVVKLRYQISRSDDPVKFMQDGSFRFRRERLTEDVFHAVKKSIRQMKRTGLYKNMAQIAEHHNIGSSTAYRIAKAKDWLDYRNR